MRTVSLAVARKQRVCLVAESTVVNERLMPDVLLLLLHAHFTFWARQLLATTDID